LRRQVLLYCCILLFLHHIPAVPGVLLSLGQPCLISIRARQGEKIRYLRKMIPSCSVKRYVLQLTCRQLFNQVTITIRQIRHQYSVDFNNPSKYHGSRAWHDSYESNILFRKSAQMRRNVQQVQDPRIKKQRACVQHNEFSCMTRCLERLPKGDTW
jgi:hypothetical protein